MTTERELLDILDARLRDVPPLRPAVLSDVFARTRATPQRQRRWPLTAFVRPAHVPISDGHTRPRGFAMFSGARSVVATVIVALFGGLLLAGLLATPRDQEIAPGAVVESPPPMTTEAFLGSMVTEEVEPGVLRIVNDGQRDLAHRSDGYPWECERVIVGDTDQVWRANPPCWRLFRLGQAGEWDNDPDVVDLGWHRGQASLDGRLWALEAASLSDAAPYGLRQFDDGAWVPDPRLDVWSEGGDSFVQDDGTAWLISQGAIHWAGDAPAEGKVPAGSSSWDVVWAGTDDRDGASLLSVTDDGVAWLMTEPAVDGSVSFLRFDGTEWRAMPGPDGFDGRSGVVGLPTSVSASGSLWAAGDAFAPHLSLARLDDEGWTTFTQADGVAPWGGQRAWWGTTMDTLWAAPDGSVWVNASLATIRADGTLGCDGLARFDGETWQPFFAGSCISDLDFAPDGSVWVVVNDRHGPANGTIDTYVITAEALAAGG